MPPSLPLKVINLYSFSMSGHARSSTNARDKDCCRTFVGAALRTEPGMFGLP